MAYQQARIVDPRDHARAPVDPCADLPAHKLCYRPQAVSPVERSLDDGPNDVKWIYHDASFESARTERET
jgi:hypothetical protein